MGRFWYGSKPSERLWYPDEMEQIPNAPTHTFKVEADNASSQWRDWAIDSWFLRNTTGLLKWNLTTMNINCGPGTQSQLELSRRPISFVASTISLEKARLLLCGQGNPTMRSPCLTCFWRRTSPGIVVVCEEGNLSYYNLYVRRGKVLQKVNYSHLDQNTVSIATAWTGQCAGHSNLCLRDFGSRAQVRALQ